MLNTENIPTEKLNLMQAVDAGVELFMKREDQIHPEISGNKWRKLKYNVEAANQQGIETLLTFGGAYSNHIAATAAAGKLLGLKTIGIIRGEENLPLNHTLKKAQENGMLLYYIDRQTYKNKSSLQFKQNLQQQFGNFYLIPEGGANAEGAKGCMEILSPADAHFDYICLACGTGTTMAGVIASANTKQKVLGFPALKGGGFLATEIEKLLKELKPAQIPQWELITDYHFGGYAKVNDELRKFISNFQNETQVPLDFIYTGKMMFGILDLLNKGYFPKGSKILAIHTGGLQGNSGLLDPSLESDGK